MPNKLTELLSWYASQCDEDWEHQHGVTIENIDNPGWHLKVTGLTRKEVPAPEEIEGEDSWMFCKQEKNQFDGYCGALDLEAVIEVFLRWNKVIPNA